MKTTRRSKTTEFFRGGERLTNNWKQSKPYSIKAVTATIRYRILLTTGKPLNVSAFPIFLEANSREAKESLWLQSWPERRIYSQDVFCTKWLQFPWLQTEVFISVGTQATNKVNWQRVVTFPAWNAQVSNIPGVSRT